MNSIGQKDVDQATCRIYPYHCSCKAGVSKTLLACLWRHMGAGIFDEGFVKSECASVLLFCIMSGVEGSESLCRYVMLSVQFSFVKHHL